MNICCSVLIILFSSLVSFSGCTPPRDTADGNGNIRFTDDIGRTIELEETPRRIISLAPNITEIIFFLGAGERLVGVTNHCDWPAGALEVPRVGDFSYPNIERIIARDPDLVLTTSHEQDRWIEKMTALGIPVYTVYPGDCGELHDSMTRLLQILGETESGRDSIRTFKERLSSLEKDLAERDILPLKVFLEISDKPLMTAGQRSFVGDLIVRAGGVNIAQDLERDYCVINPERVIRKDPDVIFLFHGLSSGDLVEQRIGWGNVGAVKNHRIYDDIDPDLVLRPGPRVNRGIREMRERMYGEG